MTGRKKRAPWIDRFNAKTKRSDGCWEWSGGLVGKTRYGVFYTDMPGKKIRAHRLAYEMSYGEVPQGKHVLHKCDNPICVRPDHLFLGTQADNMRDKAIKGRSGKNKLIAKDAYEVLWRARAGEPYKKLAEEFGINPTTVARLASRKTWPSLSQSHD